MHPHFLNVVSDWCFLNKYISKLVIEMSTQDARTSPQFIVICARVQRGGTVGVRGAHDDVADAREVGPAAEPEPVLLSG